jgi:hypothetical protein
VSGTFYLRAGGYDVGDTSAYKLTARSCDSPIAQVVDSLAPSTQTLDASDCVLSEPEFTDDSSHVKLFSLQIGPNETKTVTVTSNDFAPGLQIYGPAWGVPCGYEYEGCGGGNASVGPSNTESFTITAEGSTSCNSLQPPEHVGPLASRQSASVGGCEFFDFPGQYTVAVGGPSFNSTGSFTFAVTMGAPTPPPSIVGADVASKIPTLNFLRKKPMRAGEYLNRSM